MEWRSLFAQSAASTLEALKRFSREGTLGNKWFKVNLHVHGQGSDPAHIVQAARDAAIDLIAITDHQSFRWFEPVAAAARGPGRPLTVLPGIEITAIEGCHVLAIFAHDFSQDAQSHLTGWLEIPGTGETSTASRKKCAEILAKVDEVGGIIVVPHPFAEDIGAFDSARKISTRMEWLESGHIRLMQVPEDKVRYLDHDEEGNFLNRFVLGKARPQDIQSSTYCLAPFNRSDAHKAEEVPDACSWFRMGEATVAGLKQVACEPYTRISRAEPAPRTQDCILGVRVSGGYCDGEFFQFSDALTCIVGQNYSGKSSVFDFIRFALCHEQEVDTESSGRLLRRLNGILKPSGSVELYVRLGGTLFVVRRGFNPTMSGREPHLEFSCANDRPQPYSFDEAAGSLVPVENFRFPIEVYEQGRIGRLREDVGRQLEMLDEFANLGDLVAERDGLAQNLTESAKRLKPLYERRESLNSEVGTLAELETELAEKQKHLPDAADEQAWANATAAVQAMESIITDLTGVTARIPLPGVELVELADDLEILFGQRCPEIAAEGTAERDVLVVWRNSVEKALTEIAAARTSIIQAVHALAAAAAGPRTAWQSAKQEHDRAVSDHVAKAGFESPKELIVRVEYLRKSVNTIRTAKQPQLLRTNVLIAAEETARENLLNRLTVLNEQITAQRRAKAQQLTAALGDQMRISLTDVDRTAYQQVLQDLCTKVASQRHNIRDREGQLGQVIKSLPPLALASALRQKGAVTKPDGTTTTLQALCGITENTQNVLCSIANDIELLNRLQTVALPDVPQILVRRRGETTYANLRTGLSPGEQSAAILLLALQTRTMPLILDQPEEDLGYSYVVHLIVPKILQAKVQRQLLVVTLVANIPVLGDADFVTKMENRPLENGRQCVAASVGCFESKAITGALLELEGGAQAFQFRQHRYRLASSPPSRTMPGAALPVVAE